MTEIYVCRLCLHTSPTTFSILNTKAADMLEALTDIKVEPSDEVLTMCLKCSLNLKLAYNIQRNFLLCDEKIKKGFLRNKNNEEDRKLFTEEIVCDEIVIKEESDLVSDNVFVEVEDDLSMVSDTEKNSSGQLCVLCDQSFNDKKSYKTHLFSHPEYASHKCEKCDLIFMHKSLFDIHMKNKHPAKIVEESKVTDKRKKRSPKGPPFICEVCGKEYQSNSKLHHHRYGHRRKECPICKKSITSYNFYTHMQNHNSGPQMCEQCGKTYSGIENLRGHIFYEHSGRIYECKECNLTFKSRQTCNNHNKRNHGAGTGHVCETCGRKFLLPYLLKKHILTTHMNLRPYTCEVCKKSFSRLHTLKTHRRQHTNETPYKCEDCGDGFRQNVSLRAHRKSKHNFVETVTCNCDTCGKGFSSEHALKAHLRCH